MRGTSRRSSCAWSLLLLAALPAGARAQTVGCQQSWSTATVLPSSRSGHAMAYDASRDRVVLFGGWQGPAWGAGMDDTWEYDGVSWVQRPVSGPSYRAEHAMAYDRTLRRILIQGGCHDECLHGGEFLDDSWSYDGTSWTAMPGAQPPGRAYHAMAYDARRRRIVLHGGFDELNWFTDTWEHDGQRWIPAPEGPGYVTASMAFDEFRGVVLVFTQGKMWEYDGTWWLARSPLAAGEGNALAFDAQRGVALLTSGSSLWTYSEGGFAPGLAPPPAYTARGFHGAVYDTSRGRMVLFGGETNGGGFLNDTWTYSGTSLVVTPQILPDAFVGKPYAVTLAAAGGTAPYTLSILSGSLPPGIAFQPPATLSGTPASTGNYRFRMTVRDAQGRTCPKAYAIRVRPAGPS